MKWHLSPTRLEGYVVVPGDKSISHRVLMLAALASGSCFVRGLADGEDVRSTASCIQALGCEIRRDDEGIVVDPPGQLRAPSDVLCAGNSGTTMRLLAGILAGQPFESILDGDASLRGRPMRRVIVPLRTMGAEIQAEDDRAPLRIMGKSLNGTRYSLPVASAQVKSSVLLAGLFASGDTTVVEDVPSRDHTERLLSAVGVNIVRSRGSVTVSGGAVPQPFSIDIPGDISSAAFFLAAAALSDGDVTVERVGVNPTRTAFLDVLSAMGATVDVSAHGDMLGEPYADVRVTGPITRPISLSSENVPGLVDELPLVGLLMTQAEGTSILSGASELRVKESDRIVATCAVLRAFGARIEERPDGWIVRGPTALTGKVVDSVGDHRIALLGAIAGLHAAGETVVTSAQSARVSFPHFETVLAALGGNIRVA